MNKQVLVVPRGIRFISDWVGYDLNNYAFPHILNKTLTGCGYTEYCLRNNQNVILLSPRKMLLENKEDQHKGEVFYAKNEIEKSVDFEIDISNATIPKKDKKKDSVSEIVSRILNFKNQIKEYILQCMYENRPAKVLVTYDSYRHVKEVLEELGILNLFQIVVDEFQSIFIDARFKSDTELELLSQLQGIQRLCYVSATPMLDTYLDRLEEFKDLPYLEMDWISDDPDRVARPKLDIRFTQRGLNEEINKVIQPFLQGNFEKRYFQDEFGRLTEITSNEAVIFVNSVKSICRAIVNNGLTLGQCNVLCAKTEDNNKAVRAAFNEALKKNGLPILPRGSKVLGSIPGKGEPHKMFTFCTRTVYLGADFYSRCARTFIFSDANINCLSVDISMDLEQILGRQRLLDNPWKDSALLVVKTNGKEYTKEDFDNEINKKIAKSEGLLRVYREIVNVVDKHYVADNYQKVAKAFHYLDDYVAVNCHCGKDLLPVFNNLMLVAEQRAFDMQQIDYKDRFSVFNAIKQRSINAENDQVNEFVERFNSFSTLKDKLKYLHEVEIELSHEDMAKFLERIPPKIKDYYMILGTARIKALRYNEPDLILEINRVLGNQNIDIKEIIYKEFLVGERYSKSFIKNKLRELYENIGYQKTPKAVDLEEYFEMKSVVFLNKETGKRDHGFEIVSKKG